MGEKTQTGQTKRSDDAKRELFSRRAGRIALACLLIAAFVSLIAGHFIAGRNEAYVTMAFNYDQASEGLTPTGTRLNLFEMKTEPVLRDFMNVTGLTDKVTMEELSDCISIRAASKPESTDGDVFISTAYRIGFHCSGKLRGYQADVMLEKLCEAYRRYFINQYAVGRTGLGELHDVLDYSDEFFMQYEILALRLNQISRYAEIRFRESGGFGDAEQNLSFSGIRERAENLRNYDLYNFLSFIESNGVSAKPGELSGMMSHRYRMQRAQHERIMARYAIDNEGISLYEKAMTAIFMIPTIDENSRYYMSMTRSAMNDLGEDADMQLADAMDLLGEMQYTRYIMNIANAADKKGGRDSAMLKQRAQELLETLLNKTDTLSRDLETIDRKYVYALAEKYLTFSAPEHPLLDGISPIVAAVLVIAAGVLLLARSTKNRRGGRAA